MHGQPARAKSIRRETLNGSLQRLGRLADRPHPGYLKKDDGQTFVEYALILTLIAVAAAALAQRGPASSTAIGDAIGKVTAKL